MLIAALEVTAYFSVQAAVHSIVDRELQTRLAGLDDYLKRHIPVYSEPNLRAVAINYGALPTDRAALDKIQALVLGNFGGLDHGITPDSVNVFVNSMKSLGKSVDAKIYPDAGHAFENPNNTQGYRPEDANDAQQRMRSFFAKTLKP